MPLPDERPRQSVANLIGRFEQQNKRTSLSASTSAPQRLFSVSSHNTGESLKEEPKEKREWTLPSAVKEPKINVALDAATSMARKPSNGSAIAPPVSTAEERVIAASASAPAQVLLVTAEPESIEPLKSALVTPPESPPTKPVTPKNSKLPTSQNASNHSRTSATTTTASSRSLPKPTAASVSRIPSTPSKSQTVAKPLKPQLTGQSATSTTSTVRAKSRAGISAPSTPARPVNNTPSRPKTPSGLYAPTAASLAKAKGAQPPLPTPTRKAANAAAVKDVMERLSKPTAASASKSRIPLPPAATSPPRLRTISTAAKGAGVTKAAGKPRAAVAATNPGAKAKLEKEKKEKEKVVAKAAGVAVVAGVGAGVVTATATASKLEPPAEAEVPHEISGAVDVETAVVLQELSIEEEALESASQPAEEIESYDEDFLDDTVIHDHVRGISEEVLALEAEKSVGDMFASVDVEGEGPKGRDIEENREEAEKGEEKEEVLKQPDAPGEVTVEAAENEASPALTAAAEPVEDTTVAPETTPTPATADSGDDLANLVKMLEQPPKPASDASSIPDLDQAGVIPDDIPDDEV